MRNISQASLEKLQATSNVEPLILLKIYWNGIPVIYGDRKVVSEGVLGKIITLSDIDDIIDVSSAASSVELSVILDDSDGELKNIYDQNDIHKVYVQVLQWFAGIPLTEAFILFEGEISSPIVWSEGARTLSFNIVTKLEDLEVGFSAEEGQFNVLPASMIGVPWPIVFGNVFNLSPIQMVESPSAILSSGFGIVNRALWDADIADLLLQLDNVYFQIGQADFLRFQAQNQANYYTASPPFGGGDPVQAQSFQEQANGYQQQFLDYASQQASMQAQMTQMQEDYELQKSLEYRTLQITASNLPANVSMNVQIGNHTANAVVVNNTISLSNLQEIEDVNQKLGVNQLLLTNTVDTFQENSAQGQKFIWYDGGTQIQIRNYPLKWVVSLGEVNVVNVWGRTRNGRQQIPRDWYIVSVENYNGLVCTCLTFPMPITSRPGFWEDSPPIVDTTSGLTNVVDIMIWAITTFSQYSYNVEDFELVKQRLQKYPANFALTQRKNLVEFLQDLAFQSRCAIWVNDRVFRLRFLPEEPITTETITDADVEVDSLSITSVETEKLVTKFTAIYRAKQGDDPYKIIYRNNIKKYGTLEEEYDFYIYNNYESVAKAAEFWMLRKSNSWKHVICKVLLHKLNIEAFDPITVDFNEPLASNSPVTGIVQSSVYNSSDNTLQLTIELPVRLGEMEKYVFAYPYDVQLIHPILTDPNIRTGNPFEEAQGELFPQPELYFRPPVLRTVGSFTWGRGVPIADANDFPLGEIVIALNPNSINQVRPAGLNTYNSRTTYAVKPIQESTINATITPVSYFGQVVSQVNDYEYSCRVYFRGLSNSPTLQNVLIAQILAGEVLPVGYPLVVHKTVYALDNGSQRYEFWAQPPLWIPLDESEQP